MAPTINTLLANAYDQPLIEATGPQSNPGELINWPMLKLVYRTDKDKIAALLPPGIAPGDDPFVNITIYNVPIQDAPEYGVVINVNADYEGTPGEYTLSIGINQEMVVYPSQERWGQPKSYADTHYWRMQDVVEARVTHLGHTYIEFKGKVVGAQAPVADADQNEWWIKCLRGVRFRAGCLRLSAPRPSTSTAATERPSSRRSKGSSRCAKAPGIRLRATSRCTSRSRPTSGRRIFSTAASASPENSTPTPSGLTPTALADHAGQPRTAVPGRPDPSPQPPNAQSRIRIREHPNAVHPK